MHAREMIDLSAMRGPNTIWTTEIRSSCTFDMHFAKALCSTYVHCCCHWRTCNEPTWHIVITAFFPKSTANNTLLFPPPLSSPKPNEFTQNFAQNFALYLHIHYLPTVTLVTDFVAEFDFLRLDPLLYWATSISTRLSGANIAPRTLFRYFHYLSLLLPSSNSIDVPLGLLLTYYLLPLTTHFNTRLPAYGAR